MFGCTFNHCFVFQGCQMKVGTGCHFLLLYIKLRLHSFRQTPLQEGIWLFELAQYSDYEPQYGALIIWYSGHISCARSTGHDWWSVTESPDCIPWKFVLTFNFRLTGKVKVLFTLLHLEDCIVWLENFLKRELIQIYRPPPVLKSLTVWIPG